LPRSEGRHSIPGIPAPFDAPATMQGITFTTLQTVGGKGRDGFALVPVA
jgi:hypothetical protein